MSAVVPTFPDIEISLVTELTAEFGSGYWFTTILPANVLERAKAGVYVSRVKRVGGAGAERGNVSLDVPVVDIDTFFTNNGRAGRAARDIQAALLSLRGRQLTIGVVQSVGPVVGPRWLPDPNPQLYRYGATYRVNFRAGGRSI